MADKEKGLGGLPRVEAVPALIGNPDDFLIVAGLAGPAKDIGALTNDGDNCFIFAGAMGGAVTTALGLALAQPKRRVLCVTGDGDLLMSLGALATVGAMQPSNLSIVCVDNALYQETGGQTSHTGMGINLAEIAGGCGIKTTREARTADDIKDAAQVLRQSNGPSFVLLRVDSSPPPKSKRNLQASETKEKFRRALLG
jgi:thiamine pyrophosphate-dependent acetolactate synthase large subunit-like protein